jgi:membrane-associated protease RseP (regulator of RpoE activity)
MDDTAVRKQSPAVLTDIPRYGTSSATVEESTEPSRIPPLNIVLFILTFLTTTMAGAMMAGEDFMLAHPLLLTFTFLIHPWSTLIALFSNPIATVSALGAGLSFSIPLLAILLAHEMGHYVTSRYRGVPTSLPYFIPAPPIFPMGTFGAFIRMRSVPRTRRVMFDIGAAGPWAGVIVAIPAVVIGLWLSDVTPLNKAAGGGAFELGNSILFLGLSRAVLGLDPSAVNVNLHPIAFAGWLGLLVTSINLLPVGQLDGGHVIYALFPRRHRTISVLFVITLVLLVIVPLAMGRSPWWGWLLWAIIAVALGVGHPSTVDRDTPLDRGRTVAAWLTVALFAVTFTPFPISLSVPEPKPQFQNEEHRQEVMAPGPNQNHIVLVANRQR